VKLVINHIECFEQVVIDGVWKPKYLIRTFGVLRATSLGL
jgi:hypothetical protein